MYCIGGSDLKNQTAGLLGNYDGDASNDLKSRAGFELPANSSQQKIYDFVSENCKKCKNSSLLSLFIIYSENSSLSINIYC